MRRGDVAAVLVEHRDGHGYPGDDGCRVIRAEPADTGRQGHVGHRPRAFDPHAASGGLPFSFRGDHCGRGQKIDIARRSRSLGEQALTQAREGRRRSGKGGKPGEGAGPRRLSRLQGRAGAGDGAARLQAAELRLPAGVHQRLGNPKHLLGEGKALLGESDLPLGRLGLGIGFRKSEGVVGSRQTELRARRLEARATGGHPGATLAAEFQRLSERERALGLGAALIGAAAAEVLHIQPKGRIGAGAGLLGKTFGLTNLACRLCQLGCRSLGLSQ